ncbi:hypothetical protein Bca101_009508 [Brassica carinata]
MQPSRTSVYRSTCQKNLGDTPLSCCLVHCLPQNLIVEDMVCPFPFVRYWFSSQACRLLRLELQHRFFKLSQEEGCCLFVDMKASISPTLWPM